MAFKKGHLVSEETKRKIGLANSISNLGHKVLESTKKKISDNAKINPNFGNKGRKFSEETIKKLRESHTGYIMPEEQKINIGKAVLGKTKGRKASKETIEKSRKSHLNYYKLHPEAIINLREFGLKKIVPRGKNNPNFGKKHSEISIQRLKESAKANPNFGMRGKHHSEKSRSKMKENRSKQIMPFRDSSIEVKIQSFLSLLHLEYLAHKYISEITHGYQCDTFIPEQETEGVIIKQKTIIECDGCFYHNCPICKLKSYEWTEKRKELDDIRTQELIKVGFKVIRLWEHEIKLMNLNVFKDKLEVKK
jgi:G:T-mismatch repair DNA endonuclease (very short patch repair protein)